MLVQWNMSSRLIKKGRITIPKEIREKLNMKGVVKLIVKDNVVPQIFYLAYLGFNHINL